MSYHEDIKKTVLEFIKDLKDNVFTGNTEQGELALVEFFFKKMNATSVASHVVSHVLPHEKEIENRDLRFFLKEKTNIFGGLPADRVDHFSQLVTLPTNQGGLSAEDKETAWSYFDSLIDLSKKYKKNK
jgi:hypothetical protein